MYTSDGSNNDMGMGMILYALITIGGGFVLSLYIAFSRLDQGSWAVLRSPEMVLIWLAGLAISWFVFTYIVTEGNPLDFYRDQFFDREHKRKKK